MVRNKLPLEMHPAFRAESRGALAEHIRTYLAVPFVLMPGDDQSIDARSNHVKLKQSELWYCAYGLPMVIDIPDSGYLRLQVGRRGSGATEIGAKVVAITERQACISTSAVRVRFEPDLEKIVWRLPRAALVQKLALMTGRPVDRAPDFDPVLDLTERSAANLMQMLTYLIQTIDMVDSTASSIAVTELEQAFITTFLVTTRHSGRHLLEAPVLPAAPWQVRRAENYIEANWDKAITIEDLVLATGTSARTLFRTFRIHRGCSPLEFARRIRLHRARLLLENPQPTTTVTEVALACGFGDVGRFSTSFMQAFGTRPSIVLNKARGTNT